MRLKINDCLIEIRQGSIVDQKVDAIVNAANSSLLGGGGVDGAIHRAAGPVLLDECRTVRAKQGKCDVGEAVLTKAGNLSARFVIHTVGPVWNDNRSGQDAVIAKLGSCYTNSLDLAAKHDVKSIAFPTISTGRYSFPKDVASLTAWKAVTEFIQVNTQFESIIFVCFDKENYVHYEELVTNDHDR